ncbi:hypothetical protein TWF694_011008 [Orbilia ellipsospora]|uniref:Zn(2)-C6 fungal-type domain-containing protein n=1 Tax=Orbilia ellipsospora TaxID=2528407 RepID=A0AAV9X828_9PEZI
MPRAPVAGREIRRRSRNGCWNCKARKVKCGEEKPRCSNCTRLGEDCDYKIRLSWGGRPLKKKLLEQGAQLDDASQNIPGAGQFSLNTNYNQPQFPSPAQFELATHSSTRTSPTLSSCTSKSSGSRKSSSSQAGLATYQNVFSVCEASPPTSSLVNSSIPAPLHLASSSSPPRNYQHLHPYLWTLDGIPERPPLTPSTASTADSDLSYMSEESMFSPSSGYDFYQMSSPTPSLTHLTIGSPTSSSSIPPSPHGSFTDLGAFRRQRSISVTSNTSSPHAELTYSNGLATTVPSLSASVPTTSAGLSSQLYYASPVTPPSNQDTIRGNPYISGDKSHRRSVESFAHDYPGYASRYVQPGDSYSSQHSHNSPPFTVGIVDAEADAVEELHGASLDSKGSDGYATIKGHPAYLSLPKELNPLPSGNSQGQVYFQHFLTDTAPLLVPHDCNGNPFKSVLPQMAMNHDGLLNLLLAYSASHQARKTKSPEPTELVSRFLDRAYRHLNQSLNNEEELKSNATLATAIMLCSYEIISPNAFGEGVTWQIHLDAARKIILARGGAKEMRSCDPVSFFLSRWFAYLDVLGSFSNNNKNNTTLLFSGKYWTVDDDDDMIDFSVDCFFGFTNRFIGLLTCIGELAQQARKEKRLFIKRIENLGYAADGSKWVPEGQLYHDALRVREHLEESRRHATGACKHKQPTWASSSRVFDNELPAEDDSSQEMLALNDAFHWAAQILLFRRVLNYSRQHQCVQDATQRIIEALYKIPEKSNVENAALFPLFTAGCESITSSDRKYITRRIRGIEKSGMNQFRRARLLMKRVWETGSGWEDLINGEFIG